MDSTKKWQGLISAQLKSGKSVAAWCRENGTTPHVFSYWKSKLNGKGGKEQGNFLPVGKSQELEILVGTQIRIVISRDFDQVTLQRVLEVIGNA